MDFWRENGGFSAVKCHFGRENLAGGAGECLERSILAGRSGLVRRVTKSSAAGYQVASAGGYQAGRKEQ